MGSNDSSIAVIAKAKSKFGRQLKYDDYKKLLHCNSLPEVVSYLKTYTHYKDVLTRINANTVHRGQLELLLKQKLFYDFGALCRYEVGVTSHFAKFLIQNYEINQIIHFLTLLCAGRYEDYILSMPTYFDRHTEIDLVGLSKANNYNEFLSALSRTPYEKLLRKYTPKDNQHLQIPEIEDALYTHMYQEMYQIIEKHAGSSEKAELTKLFDTILNYINFVRIYRLKTYYSQSPEEIKSHLLPFGTLKKHQVEAMVNAANTQELLHIIESLPQGRLFNKMNYNYVGEISMRARFNLCKTNMYTSSNPSVVAISYYFLTQVELENITNIVEGTRYDFDRNQIDDLLIYK